MATNRVDRCNAKIATHNYEMLRANALGDVNGAPKLTIFLRDGMSAWLRALGAHGDARRAIRQEPSWVPAELEADMPGAGLASILTDAILSAAGAVGDLGGNR